MILWGPSVGITTIFGVYFLLLLLLLILLLSPLGVLLAAIVDVNSAHVGAAALDVMDAVNVEDAAMMIIDGE
jgi:hypothetical protein